MLLRPSCMKAVMKMIASLAATWALGSGASVSGNDTPWSPHNRELFAAYLEERLADDVRRFHSWNQDCTRRDGLPSEEEFLDVVRQGQPLIFSNGSLLFGAGVARWRNLSHLKDQFGDVVFPTSYFDTTPTVAQLRGEDHARFGSRSIDGGTKVLRPFVLERNLSTIIDFNLSGRLMYVEQGEIFRIEDDTKKTLFNELYKQWRHPSFYYPDAVQSIGFWFGRLGSSAPSKESAMHRDPHENLMLQLRGTKIAHIYPALDTPMIQSRWMENQLSRDPDNPNDEIPGEKDHEWADNFAGIDALRPNYSQFPLSRHARPYRCELYPGDVLFMPSHSYHHVVSLGEASSEVLDDGFNIGVNAWFDTDNRFGHLYELVTKLLMAEDSHPQGNRDDDDDEDRHSHETHVELDEVEYNDEARHPDYIES